MSVRTTVQNILGQWQTVRQLIFHWFQCEPWYHQNFLSSGASSSKRSSWSSQQNLEGYTKEETRRCQRKLARRTPQSSMVIPYNGKNSNRSDTILNGVRLWSYAARRTRATIPQKVDIRSRYQSHTPYGITWWNRRKTNHSKLKVDGPPIKSSSVFQQTSEGSEILCWRYGPKKSISKHQRQYDRCTQT